MDKNGMDRRVSTGFPQTNPNPIEIQPPIENGQSTGQDISLNDQRN